MTILVVGGTGTLGRQIVKDLIDKGYSVRCMVRNVRKSNFLREWGAELVYGDLTLPETIPMTLKGISTVIDAATLRAEDETATLKKVDLIGKIALVKAAKIANVEQFIFFSIRQNSTFQSIPLLRLKQKVENILDESGIPYTVFFISGFYQGLISQYGIPILEQQTIYTTQESAATSYIDSRDAAKLCTQYLLNLSSDDLKKSSKKIIMNGPKAWNSEQIIKLCEELSGQSAVVSFLSPFLIGLTKQIMSFSKWTWDIQDRLAFSEMLSNTKMEDKSQVSDNSLPDIKLIELSDYFQEYFEDILKRLKTLNYDQGQAQRRKDLTF